METETEEAVLRSPHCCVNLRMWVGAPRSEASYSGEYQRFSANIAQTLHVNVGDYIFVEGEIARVPVLRMSHGINSTIPCAYGVPFSFAIDQTQLPPTVRTRQGGVLLCSAGGQKGKLSW